MSLEQIRAFLEASDELAFEGRNRCEVYSWVERTLRELNWSALKRESRGLLRRYVEKMTGLSRAQVTRLIRQYVAGNVVQLKAYRRHRFPTRYTADDIELLAGVDQARESLCVQA